MALQSELETQGLFLFKYRSYFPLLFLALAMLYLHFSAASLARDTSYWFFCLGIGMFGQLIRVLTVGFTPVNTSGRNTSSGQVAEELNTTGIYSIVRHPLYLGNYFMWLAPALLTESFLFVGLFTTLYWLYYERIMFAEEAFLTKKFGHVYLDWAKRVPAFIPKFSKPNAPKYSFSWKKVLKKEKNGFAAVFVLFAWFDFFLSYVSSTPYLVAPNLWVLLAALSGILYFVLKLVKKHTQLLEEKGR